VLALLRVALVADQEQVARLKAGVEEWNAWRSKNPRVLVDLSRADLIRADLNGANLSRTSLIGVELNFASLIAADLSGASLASAHLRNTNLRQANLSGVNFTQAQVLRTNFADARLTGACLKDWNPNQLTNFDGVAADYVFLDISEYSVGGPPRKFLDRRPHSGNFKPGEFAALFQQALDTLDLIFVDGIDWQAFFASFQKLREQYSETELNIQAIENKGGSFVVRLEISEEANKAAIEKSAKARYEEELQLVEVRYEAQLRAKDSEMQAFELNVYRQERENERRHNTRVDKLIEMLSERERSKMPLHPNQLRILRAIEDGKSLSNEMLSVTGLELYQICYYIKSLEEEFYLTCTEFSDGISRDLHYMCRLTEKGRVAAEDPSLLIPPSLRKPQMSTTNNFQGAQIGNFANEMSGNASQIYNAASDKSLAEAAQEIQALLDQLSQTYPSETLIEKAQLATVAAEQAHADPSLRQRLFSAAKAGSIGAIDQALSHPAATFFIEAVKNWQET